MCHTAGDAGVETSAKGDHRGVFILPVRMLVDGKKSPGTSCHICELHESNKRYCWYNALHREKTKLSVSKGEQYLILLQHITPLYPLQL